MPLSVSLRSRTRLRAFSSNRPRKKKRLPFSDEWVRSKILIPGLFDDIHVELRAALFILIETGARLSEIVALGKDDIRLDADIPYIYIRPKEGRELKTPDSERKIPLVGVALVAAHLVSDGFSHYFDKAVLVSNMLSKIFRTRGLMPSEDHFIYSFRHSFEDRMKHGRLDYELRCKLMGHNNKRPEYGTGGSLEYMAEELSKIVHPFPKEIFS